MRFNSLLNVIGLSGKAHWGSPASGRVTDTRMPDAVAPFQATVKPISAHTYLFKGLTGDFRARCYMVVDHPFVQGRRLSDEEPER